MKRVLFAAALAAMTVQAAENYRPVKVTSDAATLNGQGVELLCDGKINPTCAFLWPTNNLVSFVLDLGAVKEVEGFRFLSGRSWINCSIARASFSAANEPGGKWTRLKENVAFRPANTYKTSFVTWLAARLRYLKVDVTDTYDFKPNYYSFYTSPASRLLPAMFETPAYAEFSGPVRTVQIAEAACFKGLPDDLPLPNNPETAFPRARLDRDWLYQDAATSNISHVASVTADTTKPDPLGGDISALVDGRNLPNDVWRAEHRAKRAKFLEEFRAKFNRFIYVKHIVMGNSFMHPTDDLTDHYYNEWQRVPDYTTSGSQLVLATLHEDGRVTQEILLSEPNGIIRDPNLSFDAKTLVFSKRSNMKTDNYHLWTLDLETRKLKQITFDFLTPCSDVEPTFVQDGSIVFQSTRCNHSIDCWLLPVSNLYRCNADGTGIRRIGFDQVQTMYPQVMEDGRVCYTRWEYNDRNVSSLQQLMVMNPDGTRQTGLFANNCEFPFSLLHARSVPNAEKLFMISSGHHVGQKGRLAEADLNAGDDYSAFTYDPAKTVWQINTNAVNMTIRRNRLSFPWTEYDRTAHATVTNVPGMWYLAGAAMNAAPGRVPARMPHDYEYCAYDMHSQFGPQWAYPFPLDGDKLLVSYMPEGCRYYRGPYSSRFGVYALKADGSRELLAFDWAQHCMQPVPVMERKVHARTQTKIDYREGFGTYYVQNVYEGEAMKGAPKGCVKKIRVIGLEYRPVHIGWTWQKGRHSTESRVGTPIAAGNGAFDVKHVLGEADVEEDGSAMFSVPARTPVYFQLIDDKGCCVQTMRSWSTLQPGEANGCVGCHERPSASAPGKYSARALKRRPQKLKPWREGGEHPFVAALEKDGPLASIENFMGLNCTKSPDVATNRVDGFSFVRYVQPILTAKCVACHDGTGVKAPKEIDLRDVPAGKPPMTDTESLRDYSAAYLALSFNGICNEKVNFSHGMGPAPFKGPYAFGSARSEVWRMLAAGHKGVRLTDGELRTLACWIDLCVPFCGSYVERHKWNERQRVIFRYVSKKREDYARHELDDIRSQFNR